MNTRSLVSKLAIPLLLLASAFGVSNPQNLTYPVNSYQSWRGSVVQGNSATGSSSILISLQGVQLPSQSTPYNPLGGSVGEAFVPILVDSDAVTPTAVTCGIPAPIGSNAPANSLLCNVTATWTALHGPGSTVGTNDGGLQEAINDAFLHGGGRVVIDGTSVVSSAQIIAATPYLGVTIENGTGGGPSFWTMQPTNQTAIAAPAVRTAAAACPGTLLATTVCDGTAVGTWTNASQFVAVTYIDASGNETAASTTANYTSAGSLSINFQAPAASAGAVGWRPYIGLAYLTTAYQIPVTSANCTLTTVETVVPACALTNTTYNQVGSAGTFPTPTTHTSLVPQSGGVANAYNPNPMSHTAFAYAPSARPGQGFLAHYGPFTATAALTAGQLGVPGTFILPAGALNYVGETLVIHGKFAYTPTTGGTAPEIAVEVGDITDFSTGTPKILCTLLETHTTTTVAYSVDFTCNLQTNALGTTGTIMPTGFLVDGVQAGTTAAVAAPELATGAITADVLDQDTIYIVFLQTSSAETTGPRLLSLDVIEQ